MRGGRRSLVVGLRALLLACCCLGAAMAQDELPPTGTPNVTSITAVMNQLSPALRAYPGLPVPVLVSAIVDDRGADGTLLLSWSPDTQRQVYEQRINVGTGTFSFTFYPTVPDSYENRSVTLALHFRDSEGQVHDLGKQATLEVKMADLDPAAAVPQILLLNDRMRFQPPFLQRLALAKPEMTEKSTFSMRREPVYRTMASAPRNSSYLPDRWQGYVRYHCVMLDMARPPDLDPAQRDALASWVKAGGRLAFYNVSVENRYWSGEQLGLEAPGEIPPHAYCLSATAGAGVTAFTADSETQISNYRDGQVHRLLGLLGPPPKEMRLAPAMDETARIEIGVGAATRGLQTYIGGPIATRQLPGRYVWMFGLIYLAVVAGLDYLVLRLLRSEMLTWITAPVLVVIGCVVSYQLFQKAELDEAPIRELSIYDCGLDGTAHHRSTWYATRNVRNDDFSMTLTSGSQVSTWPRLALPPDENFEAFYDRSYEPIARLRRQQNGGQSLLVPSAISQIHLLQAESLAMGERAPIGVAVYVGQAGVIDSIEPLSPWVGEIIAVSAAGAWGWSPVTQKTTPIAGLHGPQAAPFVGDDLFASEYDTYLRYSVPSRQYRDLAGWCWLTGQRHGAFPHGPLASLTSIERHLADGRVVAILLPPPAPRDPNRLEIWRIVVDPVRVAPARGGRQ